MAKSKKQKKNRNAPADLTPTAQKQKEAVMASSKGFWSNRQWHRAILFLSAFLLYANTLTHEYTQDDAIVIYDNMFTQDGLKGIPGILKYDTFYGFFKEEGKAKVVTGGRYRPFTLMMFALEYQLFGLNPFIGHLVNVLFYGFLGIMIYNMLVLLLIGPNNQGQKGRTKTIMIFIACLLFIIHPIHTEVVANIKGRDEIMTMLGSVLALWSVLKAYHSQNGKWNLIALVWFFIALMSKENAITYLAVVPLAFILFKQTKVINSLMKVWPLVVSTVGFLIIRTMILGMDMGAKSMELLNNPYLKVDGTQWVPFSGGEKAATIIFTLGKYISLLLFPHPLSHDYYPRAIGIMNFGDWQVLLSLALYISMIVAAFIYWKKDKVISFGIFYFIITLSIVSNIVFPIGTNMSERFMFMPSLGILLVLARLLTKYVSNEKILWGIIGVITLLMSIKTVTRNRVWKNDLTLFTTDVKTNSQSAKLLNAAGGALTNTASKLEDGPEKTAMLNEAIGYLKKAIKIHPTYRDAYLILGNSHFYADKYGESVEYFERLLDMYPNYAEAERSLPIVLREAGKHHGQKLNDLETSEAYLMRSYQLNPNDTETLRLLGIVNGIKKDLPKALSYFNKVIEIDPKSAGGYVNLGTTYQAMGQPEKAQSFFDKAIAIDPNALKQQGQ